MHEARFIFDMGYQVVVALLYAGVAHAVWRRKIDYHYRSANQGFLIWWATLAIISVAGFVTQMVGRFGTWTLPAYLTYTFLVLIAIDVALLGLMYYFVFLFTAKRWATNATVVYYVLFLGVLIYWINIGDPVGLKESPAGGIALDFANDQSETWLGRSLGIMLLLPLVLGALAYSSLWFKVKDRMQRFRIITVGGSIFVWLLSSLSASIGNVDPNESQWWLILSRIIAITAILANYMAFRPPAWLRRKLQGAPAAESAASSDPPPS